MQRVNRYSITADDNMRCLKKEITSDPRVWCLVTTAAEAAWRPVAPPGSVEAIGNIQIQPGGACWYHLYQTKFYTSEYDR